MAGKTPTPKRKKNGDLYPSSTGKRNPPVDQANWRRKVQQNRVKFDDDQKETYLRELSTHGLKGRAAEAACVCLQTIANHIDNDPDFAEAYSAALERYRDKFVDKAMTLAYDGIEVKKFNKDGDIIEERRDYPIRLIELELKRIEPGYREKQSLDLTAVGGVLVAPADMSPADWIAQQQALNAARQAKSE